MNNKDGKARNARKRVLCVTRKLFLSAVDSTNFTRRSPSRTIECGLFAERIDGQVKSNPFDRNR